MKRGRSSAENAPAWIQYLDRRPIVVAIAGPNGAGKSTFFEAHLKATGLRFLNADVMARELEADAYEAARMIAALRSELVNQRESFIFETVFSDPVGDKLDFLKQTAQAEYAVALCFVGIADTDTSEQRVAMRVSQGGHDVPTEKLVERFPRTLTNLAAALRELPCVLVFDNDDLKTPFRQVAAFTNGQARADSLLVPAASIVSSDFHGCHGAIPGGAATFQSSSSSSSSSNAQFDYENEEMDEDE